MSGTAPRRPALGAVLGGVLLAVGTVLTVAGIWLMYDLGYDLEPGPPWAFGSGLVLVLIGSYGVVGARIAPWMPAPIAGVTLLVKAASDGGFVERWGLTAWGVVASFIGFFVVRALIRGRHAEG